MQWIRRDSRCLKGPMMVAVVLSFVLSSTASLAGPPIPGFYGSGANMPSVAPNALPVALPGGLMEGASVASPTSGRLEIHQYQPRAIIDWQSFNVGTDAWTHFDQQGNTDWAALNRIYDQSPSQIFGRLTADGKVFLINQNGILFGPTSKVNVHSLVASSLNIADDDFAEGLWRFRAEDYINKGLSPDLDVAVSNHGQIQTDSQGSVLLLAPTVENGGKIITPEGKIILAAGAQVEVDPSGQVAVAQGAGVAGEAVNFEQGEIRADGGQVAVSGRNIFQDGLIRSVTAIDKKGKILLKASERVVTGEKSLTKGGDVEIDGQGVHHKGLIDVSNTVGEDASLQDPTTALGLLYDGALEAEDLDAGHISIDAGEEGIVVDGGLQARGGTVEVANWETELLGSGLVDPEDLPGLVDPDSDLADSQSEAKEKMLVDDRLNELQEDFDVVLSNEGRDLELQGEGGDIEVHSLADVEIGPGAQVYGRDIDFVAADRVSNQGYVETERLGSIHAEGVTVENQGGMVSPSGEITLLGVDRAVNGQEGEMMAEGGLVGMSAREVYQEGLIQALCTRRQNGKIRLLASEKVVTADKSRTACPVSDSTEKEHQSFHFSGGDIQIGGLNQDTPLQYFKHRGDIEAAYGTVSIEAEARVYLETGSSIDVSGNWVDLPAEAVILTGQLNSVELRDDYGQKGGLLQGEEIAFNALEGSSIGNITPVLTAEEKTALEMSTQGGAIQINAGAGDIIMRDGALIDFSGGGVRYKEGYQDTTKLLAYNKIYDIRDAPEWIQYDAVLGMHENKHTRFGVIEAYPGIYCGGATPLRNYAAAYVEGHDAGSLTLVARQMILDGTLDGSGFSGLYQTEVGEPTDENGYQTACGRERPEGGNLEIAGESGLDTYQDADPVFQDIVVQSEISPLEGAFDPEVSPFPEDREGKTYLSAETLTAAGLSRLKLSARASLTMEDGTHISLAPGGEFIAEGRSIVHEGAISAPGGKVNLWLFSNVTTDKTLLGRGENPDYIAPEELGHERILLAEGSSISVAGERIDNAFSGEGALEPLAFGMTHGGDVEIMDRTFLGEGVLIQEGAVIDVSGGFEIAPDGKVSAGDGGTIRCQGSTLVMDGTVLGHSFLGGAGGTIDLHADMVSVVPSGSASLPQGFSASDDIPAFLLGKLVLDDHRLEETGFTHIRLRGWNDTTLASGGNLLPSRVKLASPMPGGEHKEVSLITVPEQYLGASSITLAAGEGFEGVKESPLDPTPSEGAVVTEPGSRLQVAPDGVIEIKGLAVDHHGILEAPSGEVRLTASTKDVVLGKGSQILASGYNKPETEPFIDGSSVNLAPLPGGDVHLAAKDGDLVLESGALVDVSGSSPAGLYLPEADDTLSEVTVASNPGSVELVFADDLTLGGKLMGQAKMEGLPGGSVTIRKENEAEGLEVSSDELMQFAESGFDDLTLRSWKGLDFAGPLDLDVGRHLCLDAPEITSSGEEDVHLSAGWVELSNTYYPSSGSAARGEGRLSLSGQFIEVHGDVKVSGFQDLYLMAQKDIMLSDRFYNVKVPVMWGGALETGADLTLQATRVYPTSEADFTIRSDGKVTTLPCEMAETGPVYSAGARLSIEAQDIEHRGTLSAPMGEIFLEANDRVYLAEGSQLTTKGEGPVRFGKFDANAMFWEYIPDKEIQTGQVYGPVEGPPEKSIDMRAGEVIVREGAEVDVSGGGSVFAYKFQPGVEGSVDPLAKEGRYVILPDNPTTLPGDAVYLTGVSGLSEGTYSLLPEEYAFLPGALVIEDLGTGLTGGVPSLSEEGYPVAQGYSAVVGSSPRSAEPHRYSVRPAADVLKEGSLTYAEFVAGDGGDIQVVGETTILDGTIVGEGLSTFLGGRVTLSGKNVLIGSGRAPLPDNFGFQDTMPDDLAGKLHLATATLSEQGFTEIKIGEVSVTETKGLEGTETVTMEEGSILDVSGATLTLSAMSDITLKSDARIIALEDGGEVNLFSSEESLALLRQKGEVNQDVANELHITIEEEALIHVSDGVSLSANGLDLQGDILVEPGGTLSLSSPKIVFVPEGYSGDEADGLLVTDRLWSSFGDLQVGLVSETEVAFLDYLDLDVGQKLTIDAGRIMGSETDDEGTVTLAAQEIVLLNSLGQSGGEASPGEGGVLSLESDSDITIALGYVDDQLLANDLVIDGFREINLHSQNDLTLKGQGTLLADGDVNISAARVTTALYEYEVANHNGLAATQHVAAADFHLNAGSGAVTIGRSEGLPGEDLFAGGSLEILARTIEHAGLVKIPSGQIRLEATGTGEGEGVFLRQGAGLLAMGTDDFLGGTVSLRAEGGVVTIDEDATIDVSAGAQGDAGTIWLYAPERGVELDGLVMGEAQGGRGGSFVLDTKDIKDFSALNGQLAQGGFNYSVDFRARTDDVTVAEGDVVNAAQFKMVADGGDIHLYGAIDASGESEGGMVGLYARNDLNLYSTSRIDARGTGEEASGGDVILSAGHLGPDDDPMGQMNFEAGAAIDVSGGLSAQGEGGTVHFRALRKADNNDVHMDLYGTVTGASRVVAEGVQIYNKEGDYTISQGDLDRGTAEGWYQEAQAFVDNAGLNISDWQGETHLVPGIEIRSTGDLTLAADWDLTSWRFGEEPGVLTLRAGGDLSIDNNLLDHPTDPGELRKDPLLDSWALNLIAGADLESADLLAVGPANRGPDGTLSIADGKLVYTESSAIRFVSRNNTVIGSGRALGYMTQGKRMHYNLATYDGSIQGRVGGGLTIQGGAIQSATGDIDVAVGGDLDLVRKGGALGSIRTIGHLPMGSEVPPGYETFSGYWNNKGGGDITLSVQGSIQGFPRAADSWDTTYVGYEETDTGEVVFNLDTWSASFDGDSGNETKGIVTMGGGDLDVRAGGDLAAALGAFGEGNLSVHSGGNTDGRFLVKDGVIDLSTLGDFGMRPQSADQAFELFDGQISLTAQGGIALGTVVNPTIANEDFNTKWNLSYGDGASVHLLSLHGDVALSGATRFYSYRSERGLVLPPSLEIEAARDILISSEFYLAPSPTGTLRLEAGRDIDGRLPDGVNRSFVVVSDMEPSKVYGDHTDALAQPDDLFNLIKDPDQHAPGLLHASDSVPGILNAGRDIRDLRVAIPKRVEVSAGRDLLDIHLKGQNLSKEDISTVRAGRDIRFSATRVLSLAGIEAFGGPGVLLVEAGNTIDLGTSKGIQTVGDLGNPWLGEEKNFVVILSGIVTDFFKDLNGDLERDLLRLWFYVLRECGVEYTNLINSDGGVQEAEDLVEVTREKLITPMYDAADVVGEGDIDMTNSRINSLGSPGDLLLLANGDINVGKTAFRQSGSSDTGIYTASGGSINIFSRGDMNVNESRVMTFMGGDITMWSDQENINAGRGSKTAISSQPPQPVELPDGGVEYVFTPPSVGSGVRTLTFDPDGVAGPSAEPLAGDVYLFAPEGEIDAGEAGIAGRNVILGATEIVNAENISFSQGSAGVPVSSDGAVGLGALAGAGALAEVSKLTEETTGVASARGRVEQEMADLSKAFTPKWLKGAFIGFEEE
ncbi:MAG: filamentous hemagglutinin family protein [Thermodesulfobacteriota bacterium]|nr:filamentous hemagglutinin family protein [Thermodesulfobacteriota bacterium]